LKELGVEHIAIHTDCILFKGSTTIVKDHYPISDVIGEYKFEKNKNVPNRQLKITKNKFQKDKKTVCIHDDVDDE
jgi:hypothetical protein